MALPAVVSRLRLADRSRAVGAWLKPRKPAGLDLVLTLCDRLAGASTPPSAAAMAGEVLEAYAAMDEAGRLGFLNALADRYGVDVERLDAAVAAYQADPTAARMAELHLVSEPRRQQLIRRLNLAPAGTAALVTMRRDAIRVRAEIAAFDALDADFLHVLSSWFNGGFLGLKRLEWSSPASLLRKLIEYEAVHEIKDWDDLRRRLEPQDRRCYAFFHPRLPDEPLIFVEVALTAAIPSAIADLLAADRPPIKASAATTAVFYSISNCQLGLRGVPFGNFLIKQVVESLRAELPGLKCFVTLSPAPGFAGWLKAARTDAALPLAERDRELLALIDQPDWPGQAEAQPLQRLLPLLAARYYLTARTRRGEVVDPVARFHLANGARLERIHMLGDRSANGLRSGAGLMVNYLYDLKEIDRNATAFERGEVAASPAVHKLAKAPLSGRERAEV